MVPRSALIRFLSLKSLVVAALKNMPLYLSSIRRYHELRPVEKSKLPSSAAAKSVKIEPRDMVWLNKATSILDLPNVPHPSP